MAGALLLILVGLSPALLWCAGVARILRGWFVGGLREEMSRKPRWFRILAWASFVATTIQILAIPVWMIVSCCAG